MKINFMLNFKGQAILFFFFCSSCFEQTSLLQAWLQGCWN